MGATLLLFLFVLGVSSFTLLHQISDKTKKQIELDQLTGKVAIQLRASIITMEQSKKRLQIAKAAMIAGCVYLPSCPAFIKAFELQKKVEQGIQNLAEQSWNGERLLWPDHDLDTLQNLMKKKHIKISIRSANLTSTSEVWTKSKEINSHEWKIAWIE